MAETQKLNINQAGMKELVKLFFKFPVKERLFFFKEVKKEMPEFTEEIEELERMQLQVAAPEVSLEEVVLDTKNGIPDIKNVEEFVKKHSIDMKIFDKFEGLFDDELSAEELSKMITP